MVVYGTNVRMEARKNRANIEASKNLSLFFPLSFFFSSGELVLKWENIVLTEKLANCNHNNNHNKLHGQPGALPGRTLEGFFL